LVNDKQLRKNILNEISEIGDLERIISKVCTGRANPRDIMHIKLLLAKIQPLKDLLEGHRD
jgi:DNA mismatch repair protein MutS